MSDDRDLAREEPIQGAVAGAVVDDQDLRNHISLFAEGADGAVDYVDVIVGMDVCQDPHDAQYRRSRRIVKAS